MDNKATTKRMIGAVVLVLVAALLLAWLLKGKHRDGQDMANQTTESTPIIGFPGVGGEQKPQLVNEDPNAAAAQQGAAGAEQAAQGTQAAGGLIPSVDLKLPEGSVANTTGFDLRPAGGDVRDVVDTDGKVKEGTGNMGTGDAKAAAAGTAQTGTQAAAPVAAPTANPQAEAKPAAPVAAPSASLQDKPADTKTTAAAPVEKKPANKVVVVNEKPVPAAQSVESVSSKKAAEAKAKEAAAKQAAEKAAAEKSMKLAAEKAAAEKAKAASGTGSTTASSSSASSAAGSFVIQVMASPDKAKADALAKSLAGDGSKATVSETKVDGKVFYRVRISGYQNRDEAVAAQAKLKARYTQNQYVQNSFVTK